MKTKIFRITEEDIHNIVRDIVVEALLGDDANKHWKNYRYVHGATPHKALPDFKPRLKPIIAYKQFKMMLDSKTGENLAKGYVFPLYVNTEDISNGEHSGLKLGVWYKSGEGECWVSDKTGRFYTRGKGYNTDGKTIDQLAYRPGWHSTSTPWGSQRGANRVVNGAPGTGANYQNTWDCEVWAKIEICVDNDATEKAKAMSPKSIDQCLSKLDDSEFYNYKTNSNASKDQTWYIADKMRIIKILSDDEVDAINNEFYTNLSKETGRKINSDPTTYNRNSGDIPKWDMPRLNGVRYSDNDVRGMGYEEQEPTRGDLENEEL
jgi:hypothetical protein